MGLVPIANTYPSKLQKNNASILETVNIQPLSFLFHFPICIKHKPDMETVFFFSPLSSIFKTELQQLNI